VTVDDRRKRGGQISEWINSVELAGLDQRGDGRPVLSPGIVSGEESILPVQGYWPDGPLDIVVVDLDAAVGQEELQAIPVFGDVGQSFAEWGLGGDTGTVMNKPSLHVGDQWR
jgi:hypothetical protein